MVRRGDSSTGGAVLNAAQKGKSYSSARIEDEPLKESVK